MWYVIQTATGREPYVKSLIERTVDPGSFQELFIPQAETTRRWRGEWRRQTVPLVPGYLFVITSDPNNLSAQLRQVPALTRILGNDDLFTPLSDAEVRLIDNFTEGTHRVVAMSEGVIEGDRVIIVRGPLVNHEALITKIDRHRRKATIELDILGRRKEVQVGLEIVSRR